jgi:tetratricopeptide (TPR) repeat protein
VRAALPTSVDATRQYAAGLVELRAGDAMAARDLLQRAVAADDTHALSHLALAQAWAEIGYDTKAQNEAQRALALAAPLAREQQLWIEAFYDSAGYDWPNAIKAYQRLFDFDPDNLEYGLALADAQTKGGLPEAALKTLDRLGARAPDDPRVDLARAPALLARGELQKAADAAMQAAASARARGADLLVARAETLAASSYARLGRCDKVYALDADGERIYARAKDRKGITSLKNELARCLRYHGDESGALRVHQEILKTCAELGNKRCVAIAANNCGVALVSRSRLEEALPYYDRAVAIWREINDRASLGHTLSNVSLVHLDHGNAREGRRLAEEGLDVLKDSNSRLYYRESALRLAYILTQYGDLPAAIRTIDASEALVRELDDKRMLAMLEQVRATLFSYEGKLDAARRAFAEFRRRDLALGDAFWPVFIETETAVLDIEGGDPKAAETAARDAIARLEKMSPENMRVGIPTARQVLARSLLAQGETQAARAELDRALAIHAQLAYAYAQRLSITQARVEAAEGHREAAQALLQRVRAEAARGHYAPIELEARRTALELREAARAAGQPDAALRADARALAGEAAKLGFGLIAQKMETLAKGE